MPPPLPLPLPSPDPHLTPSSICPIVTFQVRDKFGNDIAHGGDAVKVMVSGPDQPEAVVEDREVAKPKIPPPKLCATII